MNRKLIGTIASLMAMGSFVPAAFAGTAKTSSQGQFKSSIVLDGKVLFSPFGVATSDGSSTTTYMPLYYLDRALSASGFTAAWDGQTHTWALTSLQNNLDFSNIDVGTGNTSITVNGQLVKKINVIARKDPAGGAKAVATTYAPIFYLQQLLSAIGVQSTWDGTAHKWIGVSPKVLTTGTFGPQSGSLTVGSDVYVKGDGVTLQNLDVNGSIYLDPGPNGSANLNNVTVSGKIVILSGANHSIHFDHVTATNVEYHSSSPVDTQVANSTLGTITITGANGTNTVTINVTSGSVANVVDSSPTPLVLQGQGYKVVTVGQSSTIEITGKVDTVTVTAPNVTVKVDANATVGTLTVNQSAGGASITNNGTVSSLTNNSSSTVNVTGTGSVTTTSGPVDNKTTGTTTGTTTGGGGGGGGSISGGGATDPNQAAITTLTNDLQSLYTNLTPDGKTAVSTAANNAETKLTQADWNKAIYGSTTVTDQKEVAAVQAVQDLVKLASYGEVTGNGASSDVNKIITDIDQVDPSVNGTNLHAFFVDFKNTVINNVPGMLDGKTSKTSVVSSALATAASQNAFSGFLGKANLSVNQLSTVWKAENSTIDPGQKALDAVLTAALKAQLN